MRYGRDLGCRYKGIPHDLKVLGESKMVKWEICQICNKKFRWNKGYKGRIRNAEYLKAHVRNFCQRFGITKRIYHKVYKPEKLKIII